MNKIKRIEGNIPFCSTEECYRNVESVCFYDEILEERKILGEGYYNNITTTVYNCYLEGLLKKQIESNQGLTITYY